MDWGDVENLTENESPEERCHQSVIVHGMPRNYCEYMEGFLGEQCANGLCINTHDYYRCECDGNYVPTSYGTECVPMGQTKGNQSDYDLCNNENPCIGSFCINRSGGSFSCECEQGYKRVSHRVCEDINECEFGSPCDSLLCVNTPGSYECICPSGTTPQKVELLYLTTNQSRSTFSARIGRSLRLNVCHCRKIHYWY